MGLIGLMGPTYKSHEAYKSHLLAFRNTSTTRQCLCAERGRRSTRTTTVFIILSLVTTPIFSTRRPRACPADLTAVSVTGGASPAGASCLLIDSSIVCHSLVAAPGRRRNYFSTPSARPRKIVFNR